MNPRFPHARPRCRICGRSLDTRSPIRLGHKARLKVRRRGNESKHRSEWMGLAERLVHDGGVSLRGVRRDPERMEVRVLLQRVPVAGSRLLEIGCGDGRLTRRLAGAAEKVVGLDPDQASIVRANRLTPAHLRRKVRFEVGSAETLRFRDRSFDVAVFSWSL